jgi:hypothetical protein
MSDLTDEEYRALDAELTNKLPKLGPNGQGFFSKRGYQTISLDAITAKILNAKAQSVGQTPSEYISTIVKKELVTA